MKPQNQKQGVTRLNSATRRGSRVPGKPLFLEHSRYSAPSIAQSFFCSYMQRIFFPLRSLGHQKFSFPKYEYIFLCSLALRALVGWNQRHIHLYFWTHNRVTHAVRLYSIVYHHIKLSRESNIVWRSTFPSNKMAFKDRLRSAISSFSRSSTGGKSSSSSSLSSTSFTYATSTNIFSSGGSSNHKSKISPASTATRQQLRKKSSFFRSKRHHKDLDQGWVDPPLKYSEPPVPAVVDMLAAWDWNSGNNFRRRDSYAGDVSPTLRAGRI